MMKEKRIVTMPRIFAILVVVAILGVTLGAGSALAAKGGIAGKPGGGGNGSAAMTVSPNPVIAGGDLTVTGSGFKPDQWIYFSTTCYGSFNVAVDSAGNTSYTRPAPIGPGRCTFDAYQNGGKGKNAMTLMATLTFDVVW